MKTIYTLAAFAFFATAANAAAPDCWHKTGNWTGGESYNACGPLNQGGNSKTFCETKKGKDSCECSKKS